MRYVERCFLDSPSDKVPFSLWSGVHTQKREDGENTRDVCVCVWGGGDDTETWTEN